MNPQMLESLNKSLVDLDSTDSYAKVMIYGESGVGKTVAALQIAQAICPAGKSILYIDAVEGWVSLKNHPGLTDNVVRMEYQGLSQLDALVEALETEESFKRFGVVVTDELSTFAKIDLDRVLETRSKKDPTKDPDVPTQPDFFANTERVRRATLKMFKFPVHQIHLAHVRDDKDEKQRVMIRPDFMPKVSKSIREGLHVLAYMTANERQQNGTPVYVRALQTHPTNRVNAKSRVGGLGIHCTVSDFIETLVQWLQGNVETVEVQDIVEDTSDSIVRETDDPTSVAIQVD